MGLNPLSPLPSSQLPSSAPYPYPPQRKEWPFSSEVQLAHPLGDHASVIFSPLLVPCPQPVNTFQFFPSEKILSSMLNTSLSCHPSACLPGHSRASTCIVSWLDLPPTLLLTQKTVMSVQLKVASFHLAFTTSFGFDTIVQPLLAVPLSGFLWNCALKILLSF